MRRLYSGRYRQRGAVAIMFGLSVLVLFGFMGLALDLSQTYDRKTELQNAADAAALAGAKELKGTPEGIDLAVTKAQAIARLHKFKFGTSILLDDAAITFSGSPDTPDADWLGIGAAQADPGGLYFIKIDTRDGNNGKYGEVNTYFMHVLPASAATTNTFGRAVAGRFSVGITPIGVCALDPNNQYKSLSHPGLPAAELVELGFRRGIAYDILGINPLGGPQFKYLLNPLDVPADASDSSCDSNNSSDKTLKTFICGGSAAIIKRLPGYVFLAPGKKDNLLKDELNARFTGASKNCPANVDANIKEYPAGSASPGTPSKWMTPPLAAANQTATLTATWPFTPASSASANNWGVLWSYNPAVQYAAPHTPFQTTDWPKLYPSSDPTLPAALPSYPANTTLGVPPAPYNQSSGNQFFSQPPVGLRPGVRDRRVLNIAIVDCSVPPPSSGNCRKLPIKGVGKFFMPIQTDGTSLPLEFAGLIDDAEFTTEIRLFK